MKKIIFAFIFILGSHLNIKAQFTIGGGATFLSKGNNIGLQAKGLIGISEKLDLSPSLSYVFVDSANPLIIDTDIHYDFLEINDNFRIMPFAGLSFITNTGDTSLGINLGTSIRFDTNGNSFYIEPKYRIIDFAGFVISAGILL